MNWEKNKFLGDNFCYCGLPLNVLGLCKRHKNKVKKETKIFRGRFSGKSKSDFAFNDYK
jgi:hypothetical protein